MQFTSANGSTVKEQVVDQVPKVFKELKFGIKSPQDIVNQSVMEVSQSMLFNIHKNRIPFAQGPLDPRLVSTLHHATLGRVSDQTSLGIIGQEWPVSNL